MRHVLVQIDPSDDRESVIQFQSQEQPVLENRPKLTLAVPERAREGEHTETNGDAPRVGAVFQLLILGFVQCSVDVLAENSLSAHNVFDSPTSREFGVVRLTVVAARIKPV